MSERVLEPLEMSDTEILDWLGAYVHTASFAQELWRVDTDDTSVYSKSIRDAICRVAALDKEVNRDF